jgi:SNF2 family DNA or RNA helicase
VEYSERVSRLQRLLSGFTLSRSRSRHPLLERQLPPLAEVPIYVTMAGRQRQLYDDYLVKTETKVSDVLSFLVLWEKRRSNA